MKKYMLLLLFPLVCSGQPSVSSETYFRCRFKQCSSMERIYLRSNNVMAQSNHAEAMSTPIRIAGQWKGSGDTIRIERKRSRTPELYIKEKYRELDFLISLNDRESFKVLTYEIDSLVQIDAEMKILMEFSVNNPMQEAIKKRTTEICQSIFYDGEVMYNIYIREPE